MARRIAGIRSGWRASPRERTEVASSVSSTSVGNRGRSRSAGSRCGTPNRSKSRSKTSSPRASITTPRASRHGISRRSGASTSRAHARPSGCLFIDGREVLLSEREKVAMPRRVFDALDRSAEREGRAIAAARKQKCKLFSRATTLARTHRRGRSAESPKFVLAPTLKVGETKYVRTLPHLLTTSGLGRSARWRVPRKGSASADGRP